MKSFHPMKALRTTRSLETLVPYVSSGALTAGQSIVSPNALTYVDAQNTSLQFVVNTVPAGQVTETSGVADWVLNGSVTTTTFAGSPLTIAQRNALTASAGDLVYVNDGLTNEYQFYNGTAWVAIGSVVAQPLT